MLEWRVDYLLNQEDFHATKDLETAYAVIRRHFKDVPLLTTVRTKSQGGAHKTPGGEYVSLLSLIIRSHWADVLDVEYGHEVLDTKVLIKQAHEQGIPVLMSYHKFQRAMSETELIDTYENMASFKADILKIAVMPRVPRDTASLLGGSPHAGGSSGDAGHRDRYGAGGAAHPHRGQRSGRSHHVRGRSKS